MEKNQTIGDNGAFPERSLISYVNVAFMRIRGCTPAEIMLNVWELLGQYPLNLTRGEDGYSIIRGIPLDV